MRSTQYLLVQAKDQEEAALRLAGMLANFDSGTLRFKKMEIMDADIRSLNKEMLDKWDLERWNHFEHVSAGLDMNRISNAIRHYSDDHFDRESLTPDIMSRFYSQVDKIIEIVTFLAERWHPYIVVFDLEEGTGNLEAAKERLASNPGKQFVADVKFTF